MLRLQYLHGRGRQLVRRQGRIFLLRSDLTPQGDLPAFDLFSHPLDVALVAGHVFLFGGAEHRFLGLVDVGLLAVEFRLGAHDAGIGKCGGLNLGIRHGGSGTRHRLPRMFAGLSRALGSLQIELDLIELRPQDRILLQRVFLGERECFAVAGAQRVDQLSQAGSLFTQVGFGLGLCLLQSIDAVELFLVFDVDVVLQIDVDDGVRQRFGRVLVVARDTHLHNFSFVGERDVHRILQPGERADLLRDERQSGHRLALQGGRQHSRASQQLTLGPLVNLKGGRPVAVLSLLEDCRLAHRDLQHRRGGREALHTGPAGDRRQRPQNQPHHARSEPPPTQRVRRFGEEITLRRGGRGVE